MARVIRRERPEELEAKCRCGAVVGYDPDEIKRRDGTDYGGGPDGEEWINCPGCGRKIILHSW